MKYLIPFLLLLTSPAFAIEMVSIPGNNVACTAEDRAPKIGLNLSVVEKNEAKIDVVVRLLACNSDAQKFEALSSDLQYRFRTTPGRGSQGIQQSVRDLELVITPEDAETSVAIPGHIEGARVVFTVDRILLREGYVAFLRSTIVTRVLDTGEEYKIASASSAFRIFAHSSPKGALEFLGGFGDIEVMDILHELSSEADADLAGR